MSDKPMQGKRATGYLVDPHPGLHSYVRVDGVGECREPFARMIEEMSQDTFDLVAVYKTELLYVDTSPMWMEKFIATVQRYHILIADASRGRTYDLLNPADEAAFRAYGKKAP
jgi:hypothetical protein